MKTIMIFLQAQSLLLLLLGISCVTDNSVVTNGTILSSPSQITLLSPNNTTSEDPAPVFLVEGVVPGTQIVLYRSTEESLCGEELITFQTEPLENLDPQSYEVQIGPLDFGTYEIYGKVMTPDNISSNCSEASALYNYAAKPQISSLDDETLLEDSQILKSFTVSDLDSSLDCQDVFVSSNNFSLFGDQSFVISGENGQCQLEVIPEQDSVAAGSIFLEVNDGYYRVVESFQVNVEQVDDPPVISLTNLALNMEEDSPPVQINFQVFDVDSAVSCSDVSFSSLFNLVHVQISGTEPSCVATITPLPNAFGSDTIILNVDNGLQGSAELSINISSIDDPATILLSSNLLNFQEDDSTQSIEVAISDIDSPISCAQIQVSSGQLISSQVSGDSSPCLLTISPLKDQNGSEELSVSIGGTSQTLGLIIAAVDDKATLSLSETNISFIEDGVSKTIVARYDDVDSSISCNDLSLTASQLLNVTLAGQVPDCFIDLTPQENKEGSEVITISSGELQESLNIVVTAVDDPAIILLSSNSLNFQEDDLAQIIDVEINDVDTPVSCQDIVLSGGESLFEMSLSGNPPQCQLRLTPRQNQNGSLNLSISLGETSKQISLNLESVDDAPVIGNISDSILMNEQKVLSITYSDIEGDLAESCAVSNENHISAQCKCSSGSCQLTMTPQVDFVGEASFQFTITSNGSDSNQGFAVINVLPRDQAPVTQNISSSIAEDTEGFITLSYTDEDGDLATSCSVEQLNNLNLVNCSCSSGLCKAKVSGTSNFNGSASFSYTVTANSKVSNRSVANLNITPVDDKPRVSAPLNPIEINEDAISSQKVIYFDDDGDVASSCQVSAIQGFDEASCLCQLATGCRVSFKAAQNYSGAASYQVQVVANGVTSESTTINYLIKPVDDKPQVEGLHLTLLKGETKEFEVNYSDVEGDQATSCQISGPYVDGNCQCDAQGKCVATVTGRDIASGAHYLYVTANGLNSNNAIINITVNNNLINCIGEGFDGPIGYYERKDCFYQCSLHNMCGGTVYGENTCTPKLSEKETICEEVEVCEEVIDYYKTVSTDVCTWKTVGVYYSGGASLSKSSCGSLSECIKEVEESWSSYYGISYTYPTNFYNCNLSYQYVKQLNCYFEKLTKQCETVFEEVPVYKTVCEMVPTENCTTQNRYYCL